MDSESKAYSAAYVRTIDYPTQRQGPPVHRNPAIKHVAFLFSFQVPGFKYLPGGEIS